MPDDAPVSPPARSGRWQGLAARVSTALTVPKGPRAMGEAAQNPRQSSSDEGKRQAILNLDPKERRWGLIAAALAAVLALWQDVPYILNPKRPVKLPAGSNHSCTSGFTYHKAANVCEAFYDRAHWEFELALLLAFAIAIFITVRVGRRSPVGFTLLMAGLAFEAEVGILGIPFIFGGGWLLVRAWRVQRYGSPTGTKANPSGERQPPPREARSARGKKAKGPEKKGPVASKRYTPKTPKKKRPAATPPS